MDNGTDGEPVDESRSDLRPDQTAMRHDVYMTDDSPYRICFVCSGNICRSPMAEAVMARLVEQAGIGHLVEVDSAGTGDWHIGERADRRAVTALAGRGYDAAAHRAKQFDPQWFDRRDRVVALDRGHLRTLRSWAATDADRARIDLLRAFDPRVGPDAGPDLDVADPYYAGPAAFEAVLDQVEAACRGLLDRVRGDLTGPPAVSAAGRAPGPSGRTATR